MQPAFCIGLDLSLMSIRLTHEAALSHFHLVATADTSTTNGDRHGTGVVSFSFFFRLRVLDKAEYSAFQSTLNSRIVSYRIV